MKVRIYTLLFCLSILGMQSCSKSALSDIELTDPTLVKISVRIAQDYNNQKEVQVFIRDKNSRPVQLENGWIEVNGVVAHWDRAEIHSLKERGYIYRPDDYEHDFRVYIHLNSNDVYWFDLNPSTGFPGFIRNYPLRGDEFHPEHDPYIYKYYEMHDMPFRNRVVKVDYKILKPRKN